MALSALIPVRVARALNVVSERRKLRFTIGGSCDATNLAPLDPAKLRAALDHPQCAEEWPRIEAELSGLSISDGGGGVNRGDRRAVYYLVRRLRPHNVLEIGTNVGASTVHIAAALRENQRGNGVASRLTTVDIIDVNHPEHAPWVEAQSANSPAKNIELLHCAGFASFVTSPSMAFMTGTNQKFDFIFLDGDHSAPAVYREVIAALGCLAAGGSILLHDYYPDLRPLWSNGMVIPGPFLAVQRLRAECRSFGVSPLGELPWQTKLDSTVTSLAVAGRTVA